MKFAIFTVMMPELSLEEALNELKHYGYDGVEWRVTTNDPEKQHEAPSFWGNNRCTLDPFSTEAEAMRIRKLTEEAGLTVPNLACYLQTGDLAGVERDMQLANWLGAPSIRIGVPRYDRTRTYGELLEECRSFIGECAKLAVQYRVKVLIEIHMNTIAPSAAAAYRLVEGFDPQSVGVIYDPGNMVYEGFENSRMGLEMLGPYLAHVHVKNAVWTKQEEAAAHLAAGRVNPMPLWVANASAIPEGVAHWPTILQDLKHIGYDGWLSFEDFSMTAPLADQLRDNLAYIKQCLEVQ